uniref:Uncharacterized protein n=1 Tax=Tanacetum cinerariifolium TaxID=118510 RepID=A0A6L2LW40_TANCI|nr:hypothetical protein [Tanacetum cinerariifolium]
MFHLRLPSGRLPLPGQCERVSSNYVDIDGGKDKKSPLQIEPFVNQLRKPLNANKDEVFLSDSNAGGLSQWLSRPATHHDSLIGAPLSQVRGTSRESNALPNHIALERAWFTLASGAMAQTDILKRFENLQDDYTRLAETHVKCSDTVKKLVTAWHDLEHNAKLYTDMANRYKGLKEEHSGCDQKLKALEQEKNELSVVIRDQTLWIQELEAELVRKDSAPVATKKMFADGAKERQDLVA